MYPGKAAFPREESRRCQASQISDEVVTGALARDWEVRKGKQSVLEFVSDRERSLRGHCRPEVFGICRLLHPVLPSGE